MLKQMLMCTMFGYDASQIKKKRASIKNFGMERGYPLSYANH